MVPQGTPKEALYIETGLLDIDTIRQKARIMMENRLDRQPNNLAVDISNENIKQSWKEQNKTIKQKYEIHDNDLTDNKMGTNKNITPKFLQKFQHDINDKAKDKSKIQFLLEGLNNQWTPNKRPAYISNLTRTQASTIFKARTRMLDVKNNFRGKYKSTECRLCKAETETQEHILEKCTIIHDTKNIPKIKKEELFNNDNTHHLKQTANTIQIIMNTLTNTQ